MPRMTCTLSHLPCCAVALFMLSNSLGRIMTLQLCDTSCAVHVHRILGITSELSAQLAETLADRQREYKLNEHCIQCCSVAEQSWSMLGIQCCPAPFLPLNVN